MRPLYSGRLGFLCEPLPDGAGMTNFLLVIRRYGNRSTRGDKEVEAGGWFLGRVMPRPMRVSTLSTMESKKIPGRRGIAA